MRRDGSPVLLFLSAVPPGATRKELRQFVRQGLVEAGYRGVTLLLAISRCSICRLTDPITGKSECHGLVQIKPASVALKAIDILNGKELKGAKMVVRRYYQRGSIGYSYASPRRLQERRRAALFTELIDS
jgi:hypothetical protein